MPAATHIANPGFGEVIAVLRRELGLSQTEFARRCGLARQEVAYFEANSRKPNIRHLLQIARAFDLPFQRFLSGTDRPGRELKDIAFELRHLGLIDLFVEAASIPGAFRRCEEILALTVADGEPPARIVEGVPALLSWNRWSPTLLRAFAREQGRIVVYRLAWLADVVLALERQGGFPGGCPAKESAAAFVKLIPKPPDGRWDDLGRPAHDLPASPVWKRWRIKYAANLDTFKRRAESLVSLARAEGRPLPSGQ